MDMFIQSAGTVSIRAGDLGAYRQLSATLGYTPIIRDGKIIAGTVGPFYLFGYKDLLKWEAEADE